MPELLIVLVIAAFAAGAVLVTTATFPTLPVDGGRISSPFGSRPNPFTGEAGEFHNGVDFAVPVGTPVVACADGIVIDTALNAGGDGTFCRIRADVEGGRYDYSFSHLSKLEVSEGQRVRAGELVALSGNTGRSTGPHLHLSVRDRKTFIDPATVLPLIAQLPTS